MIHISKPYITSSNTHTKLNFDLTLDNKSKEVIWYEVENKFAKYLCTERIDGIVVNLLLHCMKNNQDIVSEHPISEKLYYQLTNFFIPIIEDNIDIYSSFSIIAPLDNTILQSENAVGTGLSCGVDSFYTVLKNSEKITNNYNVTHFTFFNAGASGSFGGDSARKLYFERMAEVEPCAKEVNIPLVAVDTNINEFLNVRHAKTHTVRSLAIPLILQKLFSVYYYSSAAALDEFQFREDYTGYYDWFTLSCLNTENISFYSTGSEVDRFSKTKYISDSSLAQKYLNVCISEEKNCCNCKKCKRTIIDLYAMNKLGNFNQVFDLNYISKNIDKYMIHLVGYRFEKYLQPSYITLKESGKLSIKVQIIGNIYFVKNLVERKIKTMKNYEKLKNNKFLRKILRKNQLKVSYEK
ncbi:MAG: hypothetical protein R3Y09_09005 [Clostridia bacterium]